MTSGDWDETLLMLIEHPGDMSAILASALCSPAERDELVCLLKISDALWLSAHILSTVE